jgi:triacylglycerol lipase
MPSRSSLARLLQLASLFQMALALGWLLARWSVSPAQAVLGAAGIMFIAPLALAVEFVLVWHVGRGDSAPKPTPLQLVCAWVSETAHLFRTFYWRQPYRWRAVPDQLDPVCAGRTGVVLVHGFMCNRGFWNAWMRELRGRGRAYVAVNLEPVFTSIDDYAAAIEEAVAKVRLCTGRPPLLVCHSMGGLAARAWWRRYGAPGAVAGLLTIGTPHGGTWLARMSSRVNGRQMRLGSDWLRQLAGEEAGRPLPPHACWYSNCDNVVFPASTATLPMGERHFVPGQPHVALAFHPEVRRDFLDWLDRS